MTKTEGIKAYADGTLRGLKSSMQEAGIDYSVLLPVVTNPASCPAVNEFAVSIKKEAGILSFGGVHPQYKDWKKELKKLKAAGIKGIKLHPDFQDTFIDDKSYIHLIGKALEMGFILVIHAGLDLAFPDCVHCTAERAARMLDMVKIENFPDAKLVFAHMGGHHEWDKTEKLLVGRNIYFDTSYTLGIMEEKQFLRILEKHGTDRILFGTDSPWRSQAAEVSKLQELPIATKDKKKILFDNGWQMFAADSSASGMYQMD